MRVPLRLSLAVALVFNCLALAETVSAQEKRVEVAFRVDDKSVRGPRRIFVESGSRSAALTLRSGGPPVAPWSPSDARTVELPAWAVLPEGFQRVDVRAKVKGRDLHFRNVQLYAGLGRILIEIDSPPFGREAASLPSPDSAPQEEVYLLHLYPIAGDGTVQFYRKGDHREGDR